MKLPRRLGRPPSRSHEQALIRGVVQPIVDRVRATIRAGRIQTAGDARALGVALRKAFPDAWVRARVAAIGAKAEAVASRPWTRLERATNRLARGDASGPELVERWTKEATGRITSVRDEIAEGLRRDVIAAAEAGTDAKELAAKWLSEGVPVEFGTAEARLRVIAQNQLSTLHAQVQSERARAVGVTAFVWRTQGDAKVRPAHQALDGTRHDYDDPPSEGLPGTPVNCRCWAESVIDDDLALELGFEIEG